MIQESAPDVRQPQPPEAPPGVPAWNPLLVAVCLLALAGLAAWPALGTGAGVSPGRTLQLAILNAELTACVLLLYPARGRSRGAVMSSLLAAFACFFAASAVSLLLNFLAHRGLALASRPGALGAWLFCGGALALGARLGGGWVFRARLLLLVLFALPALGHYLALEYGGASLLHLRPWSPHWALAAGELSWLPLLPASLPLWALAFALPLKKEAP